MATKKQTTDKKKTLAKQSSKSKSSDKSRSVSRKTTAKQVLKSTSGNKAQLPSPITPFLAILAAFMTYVAFSLAIDSGSYWHYIAGFYFFYQAVRLTKVSVKTRVHDKSRRAPKA